MEEQMETTPHTGETKPIRGKEDEVYEAFVGLFAAHEASLRSFVRTLVSTWDDVDEVMQSTSIALWRKFPSFQIGSSFIAWSCTVARFEVMKHHRKIARDRLVLSEEAIVALADEAAPDLESRPLSPRRVALNICLSKLPEKQRDLVTSVYHADRKINEVATEIGKSATALYKALRRIRSQLYNCIKTQELSDFDPTHASPVQQR